MKTLFALVIFLLLFSVSFISHSFHFQKLKGSGNVVKREVPVNSFKKVLIKGVFNVVLEQGERESCIVETDDNLQDMVQINSANENLVLDIENNKQGKNFKKIGKNKVYNIQPTKMIVYITLKNINSLCVEGVGNVKSSNMIKGDSLDVNNIGVGNIILSVDYNKIKLRNAGVGDITLEGKAQQADIENAGVGNLDTRQLVLGQMSLGFSGAGTLKVNTNPKSDAESAGKGKVFNKWNDVIDQMTK